MGIMAIAVRVVGVPVQAVRVVADLRVAGDSAVLVQERAEVPLDHREEDCRLAALDRFGEVLRVDVADHLHVGADDHDMQLSAVMGDEVFDRLARLVGQRQGERHALTRLWLDRKLRLDGAMVVVRIACRDGCMLMLVAMRGLRLRCAAEDRETSGDSRAKGETARAHGVPRRPPVSFLGFRINAQGVPD